MRMRGRTVEKLLSAGFICKSASSFPCESLPLKLKKGIPLSWLMYKSYIRMEMIKIFRECFKFILTRCPNKENTIDISKRCETFIFFFLQKFSFHLIPLYMQAYVGAHSVPMAVPGIFWLIWPLKPKLVFNTNSAIWTNSSVGSFFLFSRLKLLLNL